MKNYSLLLSTIVLASCSSLRKNQQKTHYIPPEKLKQDVDFAYYKLKKMHPRLYQYISKQDLDYKIDSLKQTIHQPLTPTQFYFKLQPVITSIRQGHLSLQSPNVLSKDDLSKIKKRLFMRFRYRIQDNHLYIVQNRDSLYHIKPGTEVISINDIPVSLYIEKYKKLISSDGFNTTFQPYYLKDMFFHFYTLENGLLDSAKIETLYDHKKQTYIVEREKEQVVCIEKPDNSHSADNNPYNRNFRFLGENNSVAYLKIKKFSHSPSDPFYKNTFAEIKDAKTSYLIIDIRNNYGGSLEEINDLYSYLTTQSFILIKPSELSSSMTPLQTNYFKRTSALEYAIKGMTYPTYIFLKALNTYKGKDGKSYYKIKADHVTQPNKNAFQGKIFVLVNGGSFSSSSILSSKLKYDRRATLVGEETGGANDGSVAGFYSYQVLPNSRLTLPIGLLLVNPNIALSYSQKGVIPNMIIPETLQDIIDKKDPQLDWVKNEIAKEQEYLSK
ncbi:S41 family peptidase [Chryseobacterium polytrichastri]|uniref:Peptidase family S41 n=1 Tax=Chryseobacterium polytrichastri TaxID=1302687 RepID=A0A1M6ZRA4_9FLAO|nr:S41 family peptidase [Chryseobacterium polytrichastri]SHL33001.1 Peptidase family S41 [Chryseobacterium polytrichastri]